jgi:hypothetical protein
MSSLHQYECAIRSWSFSLLSNSSRQIKKRPPGTKWPRDLSIDQKSFYVEVFPFGLFSQSFLQCTDFKYFRLSNVVLQKAQLVNIIFCHFYTQNNAAG